MPIDEPKMLVIRITFYIDEYILNDNLINISLLPVVMDSSINYNSSSTIRWRFDEDKNDLVIEPTSAPSFDRDVGDDNVPVPTPTDNDDGKGTNDFGWFLTIIIVVPITFFILYRCYIRYQRRYEQQMLDYRSRQADRVLGDMQMVPNEDLDVNNLDNELI